MGLTGKRGGGWGWGVGGTPSPRREIHCRRFPRQKCDWGKNKKNRLKSGTQQMNTHTNSCRGYSQVELSRRRHAEFPLRAIIRGHVPRLTQRLQ